MILISHDMPHVFELADRIQIMRLGRRVAVVTPQTHTMPEAVAIMTGATPSELARALDKEAPRPPIRRSSDDAGRPELSMTYLPADNRYDAMLYRRCGRSGLQLPAVSLGLWQNFGHDRPLETSRAIVRRAFDLGITHFDLANNYGPPYGSAEENFGRLLRDDLAPYRDELVVSTKAGYDMWPGPVRRTGARASTCSRASTRAWRRLGLDYVDIFYSHRFDPDTPLEETMGALDTRRAAGQGALRRHLVVLGGEDPRGGRDPARPGHAAAHPPAVVLDAEPLDRGASCSTRSRPRASAASASRRSRRGC